MFYLNGNGRPDSPCKACKRVRRRERYGRKYRRDAAFRRDERARKTAYRLEHAEKFRAYRLAYRARRVA
jgi:hypothetical protein